MRALDTGEHTATTHLAAWQIDLGTWWVIDSCSSGCLRSSCMWMCVCRYMWRRQPTWQRKKARLRERKRGKWQWAADAKKEKVIVGNLVQDQMRIKVQTWKWSGPKVFTRHGNLILVWAVMHACLCVHACVLPGLKAWGSASAPARDVTRFYILHLH